MRQGDVLIQQDANPGKPKANSEPKPAWGRFAGGEAWVRCQCGQVLYLDHDVAADGTVSPSLWHDEPGCGYHVMATLQGWQP